TIKLLRHVPETGEALILNGTPRRFRYSKMEYHDCIEEIFVIEGDVWLGNSGLMVAGSYFWRPAYITHGPFYCREGRISVVWMESTLVNHHVDDPPRTPEENRAESLAKGALTDYLDPERAPA